MKVVVLFAPTPVVAKREGPGRDLGREKEKPFARVIAKRIGSCRDRRCETEKPPPSSSLRNGKALPPFSLRNGKAHHHFRGAPDQPRARRCETETRNNFSAHLGDRQIQIVNLFLTRFISR
jgi:hypothetical protein